MDNSQFFLINLSQDPSMTELLVYYLKEDVIIVVSKSPTGGKETKRGRAAAAAEEVWPVGQQPAVCLAGRRRRWIWLLSEKAVGHVPVCLRPMRLQPPRAHLPGLHAQAHLRRLIDRGTYVLLGRLFFFGNFLRILRPPIL